MTRKKNQFKQFIKSVTPSLVHEMYSFLWVQTAIRTGRMVRFTGNFKNYSQAESFCTGYNAEAVVDRYLKDAQEYRQGKIPPIGSRDVHIDQLMTELIQEKNRISILDFGGATGADYYKFKTKYKDGISQWVVVENQAVAKALQHPTGPIFTDSAETYLTETDLLYISGTLQYLPDPKRALQNMFGPAVIFINRTPFWDHPPRLMKQTPPKRMYKSPSISYPCWILNKQDIRDEVEKAGYSLVKEISMAEDKPYIPGYGFLPYSGMIFKKISSGN
ncbi:MAG: hypothetical protein KCHDKBKB_01107 [Elusimicrobia bacterium]|nr:hypothetical protein [Elusimicrobiota bacterium]